MSQILVVDDEPACRDWTADVLRVGGHEAVAVGDAAGALLLLRSGRPDLIVLDLMMPGMDGVGFLLATRSVLRGRVPVIVVTRGATPDVRDVVMQLGVAAVLSKVGLTPEQFLAEVERALAARASHAA